MNKDTNRKNILLRYLNPKVGLAEYFDVSAAAENIKSNISFKGPNVYILACAIIIASVGLNVNSIPVIIGAMLISPLMGPIVGMGMALGTNNMRLLYLALRNLVVMVAISIVASTLYFMLTPLALENPTELLARTNPTIYDVLIAFFGGFAGILETSRKERGTVLSGVAIATALMPPLCTIGFGIAMLNLHYVAGALYLFFINSVFIATAAYLGAKFLGYESVRYSDEAQRRKISRKVAIATLVIIIPSIFSAVDIVRQNNFERSVAAFVRSSKVLGDNLIYDTRVAHDRRSSTVELFLTSDELDASTKETLYVLAEEQGIGRGQMVFNTSALGGLQSNKLVADLYKRSESLLMDKDRVIDSLQRQIKSMGDYDLVSKQLAREVCLQYPKVQQVAVVQGTDFRDAKSESSARCKYVIVKTKEQLSSDEHNQLHAWLKVRLDDELVQLIAID